MAPQMAHAVATVYSAQVRSTDEKSILVEAGGFKPMRWFLERGAQAGSQADEPPKKKRKVEPETQPSGDQEADIDGIPLLRATIDFHFPEALKTLPPSEKAITEDTEFEADQDMDVVPYGFDTDPDGTRLRLSSPAGHGAVLFLECATIPKDVIELLGLLAPPGRLKAATAKMRNYEHPASLISCKLSRSVGKLYTVVRLQATLKWRAGVSAFPSGSPVGRARVYPDYNFLLHAFPDLEREAFGHSQPWTPHDFYESVHVPSKEANIDGLRDDGLEIDLYPFQKRAVHWMLDRERALPGSQAYNSVTTSSSYHKSVCDLDGRQCYVNHLQGIITRELHDDEASQLSGGLLAEEMGLGKTVEIMSLISQHKPANAAPIRVFDQFSGTQVIKSRATLIITPTSILQQWQNELRRHAANLSVFHYEGIPTGSKKGPSQDTVIKHLATKYDVVLATYTVLAKEIHYAADPPDRSRRREAQYERKRSPLVQIQWWRVCLDEAQMVESGLTAAAQVACRLPRVHSWAVTGTPLRKNAQDLQGLLIFLRYPPFNEDKRLWSHLITNHRHLFRKVFNRIALRHTKALVRDELRLPPQKRVVVTVPFSVIEQQNYSTLFQQMCEEVEVDANGAPITEDWNPNSSATLEAMRSWLTRLRQTCLHPQVGGKNRRALGRGSGPLRTVAEVLEVMIEQNESQLRTEERSVLSTSLTRAHILGNNEEDERRSEKALAIYEEAVKVSQRMVEDSRKQLADVKSALAQKGELPASDTEEKDSSESTPVLGRAKTALRTALQLHHVCVFFAATAHFQIKTNDALTLEGSDRYKELEAREVELYDTAKLLRKEILLDTTREAESFIGKIKELETNGTLTRIPKIKDLQSLGGIESRRIVEKSDELFDVIRDQVEVIKQWRAQMAEFLVKPLVDEEGEGLETTGDEYEVSTKQQDELYVYFDAFKAIHADLNGFITGETTPLIDHEVKDTLRAAKNFLDPTFPDGMKRNVHAPELVLKLFPIRNKFRAEREGVGSIRGLIQEARALEDSMQGTDGSLRAAEHAIVKQHLTALNAVLTAYTKALSGLEKEVELFRTTQNQRVEFYRQLQELSDAVTPYKDELDPVLDEHALANALQKEEQAVSTLAQLRTKNRFLLHLREETGAQVGPKICIICTSSFERGVLTVCGHQFCKECIQHWFRQARSCPMCKRQLSNNDIHDITFKPQELKAQEETNGSGSSGEANTSSPLASSSLYTDVDSKLMDEIKSIDLPASYGTKIDTLAKHLLWIRQHDPGAKSIVFSQYREFLDVLGTALKEFKIGCARLGRSGAAEKFRNDAAVDCLLLDAKTDSSGLTLVNATHVFICEPLIQTAVELQAIARVHRIGQTRQTTVWMYLINDTVEEAIYEMSVARRLAHVQSRQQQQKSRSSTPGPLQENAIDAANSEELQAAPLTKLLVAGKSGGELVSNEDLWQCLFGKARQTNVSVAAEREVGRHLRAEAAEERQVSGGASST